MGNEIEVIRYGDRLKVFLGGFNYFFIAAAIFSFIFGSWVSGILITIISFISLYFSFKNARYYLHHINFFDETDIVKISFFDKEIERTLNLEKKNIKIDLIDDGYSNHLRFYYNSEMILKQYIVGYWTREKLSKFYENYCKGKLAFENKGK